MQCQEIYLFIVNTSHRLSGQAPKKTTTTIKCDVNAKLGEVLQKLFTQYVLDYSETYQSVSEQEFLDDVRLIYAGKKYLQYDRDKRLSDLRIGDCATIEEFRAFGNSACAFPLGLERRNFIKLQAEDPEAAKLLFLSTLSPLSESN